MPPRLLLVGVSTRALAASVRRSGYRGPLVALDLFADADQERLCRCLTPGRDLPAPRRTSALLRCALRLRPRQVALSGGAETHPRLLARLEKSTRILGNSASAVSAVRDPRRFFKALEEEGLPHPRTWAARSSGTGGDGAGGEVRAGRDAGLVALARAGGLLWKPGRGSGGLRIRPVAPGGRVGRSPARRGPPRAGGPAPRTLRSSLKERSGYLQEWMHGVPGSVSFVAGGRRAAVLGYCRQLSGETALGAPGFAYSGNLWGPAHEWLPPGARETLARAVQVLAARFGLRGLNGLDFVLSDGVPYLLEVNPRYTASMELIEEGEGLSLFALHRAACLEGRLPEAGSAGAGSAGARSWLAKGIVYATRALRIETTAPFTALEARDIPRPGVRVRAGAPLCTLVVRAAGREACLGALLERAERLREALRAAARPRKAS